MTRVRASVNAAEVVKNMCHVFWISYRLDLKAMSMLLPNLDTIYLQRFSWNL